MYYKSMSPSNQPTILSESKLVLHVHSDLDIHQLILKLDMLKHCTMASVVTSGLYWLRFRHGTDTPEFS